MKIFLWSKDKIQHMIYKKNMLRLQPNLKPIFLEIPLLALDWLESSLAALVVLDSNMSKMPLSSFLKSPSSNKVKMNTNELSCFVGSDDFQKGNAYTYLLEYLGKSLQFDMSKRLLNS